MTRKETRSDTSRLCLGVLHFDKRLSVSNRIIEVEKIFEKIIVNLLRYSRDQATFDEVYELNTENIYFDFVFKILIIYLLYKKEIKSIEDKDVFMSFLLKKIKNLKNDDVSKDFLLLACNFFILKIKNPEIKSFWTQEFKIDDLGTF